MPYGPFHSACSYHQWVRSVTDGAGNLWFFAFRDLAIDKATGVVSYLRIQPQTGSIEVGHLNFSVVLRGLRAATEAMYLMVREVFETEFRRYE